MSGGIHVKFVKKLCYTSQDFAQWESDIGQRSSGKMLLYDSWEKAWSFQLLFL